MACIHLYSSAVRVHDPQAYRKMDVTWEHCSRTLELREILLPFQTGFTLSMLLSSVLSWRVSQAGVDLSSVITVTGYLQPVDCLRLLFIYFDPCVDADGVVINLVFSALISMPQALEAL